MQCLFFLYGEYRTFPTAVKTWNILNIPNLDIVIHTPTTSSDFRFSEDFNDVKEEYFSILDNPKIFFYERNEFKKTDKHLLHFSFRFLSQYLKLITVEYDYIFIGRVDSDFYLKNYQDFISIKRNYLFVIDLPYMNPENPFMPDHIFFGNGEMIRKFVDNLPSKEDLWDSHCGMAIYIHNNFDSKKWKNFNSIHIRPNMVNLFENYFSKNSNIQNIDDSYENFIKNKFYPHHIQLEEEYYRNYRNDI